MKNRKSPRCRVALIFGGMGAERDVSIQGAANISRHIDKEKYILYPIEIDKSGQWLAIKEEGRCPIFPVLMGTRCGFIEGDKFVPCRLAFPLLHGDMGEDGRVQGLLDCLSMKYVGCGVYAGAVCADKACTKILAERLGIPTVKWICAEEDEDISSVLKRAESVIGYPMFIKPARQGSSIGAHPVMCRDDFYLCYPDAQRCKGRVLVEEYIEDKRELECAYLKACGREIVAPAGEVVCRGFYGYDEKYCKKGSVSLCTVADVSSAVQDTVREYTKRLAKELDIRHLSRFDFFLSQDRVLLNEINTMPGFTNESLYGAMIERAGVPLTELLSLLIEDARGK